jgi:hypothetical protein
MLPFHDGMRLAQGESRNMNTKLYSQNLIAAEGIPPLGISLKPRPSWYFVRSALLVTLAILLGVLGLVLT